VSVAECIGDLDFISSPRTLSQREAITAGWRKCIISLLRLQFGSWSHVNARDAWLYSCCNINHSHNLPPRPCSTTSHPTACIEQLKAQVQQQQHQQINIICSQ